MSSNSSSQANLGFGCFANETDTIGVALGNLVTPYNVSNPYQCAPGFYCPNVNAKLSKSRPTVCLPSATCTKLRLSGTACPPQGSFEPSLCLAGKYCPDQWTQLPCPEGYFCLTGSIAPTACPPLSICQVGSTTPTPLLGVVIVGIIDSILLVFAVSVIFMKMRKAHLPWSYILLVNMPFSSLLQRLSPSFKQNLLNIAQLAQDKKRVSDIGEDGSSSTTLNSESSLVTFFRRGLKNDQSTGTTTTSAFNFKFSNLGLTLSDTGKTILRGVDGEIKSGRMTAIMGPSGAGKTTFMRVLMGKATGITGTLEVNGVATRMNKYKNVIGYVPQEDIMLRELTVRETILHSARCRLPSSWKSTDTEAYVDAIIDSLGMSHVADTIIGDENQRGISGGQRKRVNIAMELAAIPLALFLDEPTSGLDSTASLKLCDILNRIAKIGIPVVSVIHQPRQEVFQQFDDVLFLVPGGQTAYFGPVSKCQEYFETLGFQFPPLANPADVISDILSGKPTSKGSTFVARTPDQLVNLWKQVEVKMTQSSKELSSSDKLHENQVQNTATFETVMKQILQNRGGSFLAQVYYSFNRSIVQQIRSFYTFATEAFTGAAAGCIMGVSLTGNPEIYRGIYIDPYAFLSPTPNDWQVPIWCLLIGLSVAFSGASAGVSVFSPERTVYRREATCGHNKLAYYLGKVLSTFPRILMVALHFAAFYSLISAPVTAFDVNFNVILLMFYGVYGLSSLIGLSMREDRAKLMAVTVCLFMAVFCGDGPNLVDAKKNNGLWAFELVYNKWGAEALVSSYLTQYSAVYDVQGSAGYFGYTIGRYATDLLYMLLIGTVTRVIGFFFLIRFNSSEDY